MEELSLAEVMEKTGIDREKGAEFMNKCGTDGPSPFAGGKASVMRMCIELDEDESGQISLNELSQVFGNRKKAIEFMKAADTTKTLDPDSSSIFFGVPNN